MRVIILGLILFFGSQVLGQELETDRPDQTESSAVIPYRTLQIETGVGIELAYNSSTEVMDRSFIIPTSLFRISVSKRFELRVVNTLQHYQAGFSLGNSSERWQINNLELGTKFQIFSRPEANTQIAFMQHIQLPTGSNTSLYLGSVSKLLISHVLGDRFSIGYNLGYAIGTDYDGIFTYSCAANYGLGEKISCYFEGFGTITHLGRLVANADAGFTYLLRPLVQLDYSFGVGITERMNYQAIGLSIRVPE